jgi:hypothetical protein
LGNVLVRLHPDFWLGRAVVGVLEDSGTMNAARWISVCLVAVGLLAGTASDTSRKNPVVMLGGYRVLAADFHIHSFPLSWALLGPFDTVVEANRQGLDVIALTPHNLIWVGEAGQWFSRWTGSPRVILGEEIVSRRFHLLGIGIHRTIGWNQSAANAIDEIHAQGGIAIAAHPLKKYWRAYDAEARGKLDGTEVLHPLAYQDPKGYTEMQEFYARAKVTAIGDSDYHGLGPIGWCRTFVFVREDSEGGVLEAVRAGRTVVVDRDGKSYGNPQFIALAANDPEFQGLLRPPSEAGLRGNLAMTSRVCGMLGLLGLFVFGCFRPERSWRQIPGSGARG